MSAQNLPWHHPRRLGPWLSLADRFLMSGIPLAVLGWMIKVLFFNPELKYEPEDSLLYGVALSFFVLLAAPFTYPAVEAVVSILRSLVRKDSATERLYTLDCRRREMIRSKDERYYLRQYYLLVYMFVLIFGYSTLILGASLVYKARIPFGGGVLIFCVGVAVALSPIVIPAVWARRRSTSFKHEAYMLMIEKVSVAPSLPPQGSTERKKLLARSFMAFLLTAGAALLVSYAPGKSEKFSAILGMLSLIFLHYSWTAAKYET